MHLISKVISILTCGTYTACFERERESESERVLEVSWSFLSSTFLWSVSHYVRRFLAGSWASSWQVHGMFLAGSWEFGFMGPSVGMFLAGSWHVLGRFLAGSWHVLGRFMACSWLDPRSPGALCWMASSALVTLLTCSACLCVCVFCLFVQLPVGRRRLVEPRPPTC